MALDPVSFNPKIRGTRTQENTGSVCWSKAKIPGLSRLVQVRLTRAGGYFRGWPDGVGGVLDGGTAGVDNVEKAIPVEAGEFLIADGIR